MLNGSSRRRNHFLVTLTLQDHLSGLQKSKNHHFEKYFWEIRWQTAVWESRYLRRCPGELSAPYHEYCIVHVLEIINKPLDKVMRPHNLIKWFIGNFRSMDDAIFVVRCWELAWAPPEAVRSSYGRFHRISKNIFKVWIFRVFSMLFQVQKLLKRIPCVQWKLWAHQSNSEWHMRSKVLSSRQYSRASSFSE